MLVLAGPGSGKTFVIIQRLLYLITESHISPDSILVISFSKASTLELKQRFQKQSETLCLSESISDASRQVNFSTFHAFFFHILKETYRYTSKDIITEPQKRELLKIILSDPAFYGKAEETQEDGLDSTKIHELHKKIEEYLQKISYYKNKDRKEIEKEESEQFQKIFHAYNEEMHRRHKLDFDDMGLLCLQLLKKRPEVLKKWQEKLSYIMIDEFQDINMVQFRIVQLLVNDRKNLFVVGDDDQSIYSFRGSDPKIMLDFQIYYPDSKRVLLETNYRCSKSIVQESLKVIEKNKIRWKKEIRAKERQEEGEHAVVYRKFENCKEEYDYLLEQIQNTVKKEGYRYSDFACIFRTNQDMMGLADTLVRNKLPVSMKESCSSVFGHFIALDLRAYLQFFIEGRQRRDFLRIMNKPMRYFSRNVLQETRIQWKSLKRYYESKKYMIRNIEQLEQNEHWIRKLDLYGACFYIRKVIGYDEYLKVYCKEEEIPWNEAEEILEFVQSSTRGMESLEEWKAYIDEYEKVLKKTSETKEDGIQLITYHACKGLEYKVVFLPDCNEGKVPHKKATESGEIEEERRMFYVAMTRAQKHLEILYIKDKLKKHLPPSRFLPLKEETLLRSQTDRLPFLQKL